MGFLTSISLIFLGGMLKYSSQDGWSEGKKYWPYFVIAGIITLSYEIYKYIR
jgi:hypothetical protein